MKKFRRIASKVVAMTMAAAMTFTGGFDNLAVFGKANLSGTETAVAATESDETKTSGSLAVTATKNADTFSWDNATVYFLLTDRFVNGNTANDHSYNRGCDQNGNVVSGMDERATFHGGDFAGLTSKIEEGYFEDLGVNAIWLSAPYEQIHGYLTGSNAVPTYAHYAYRGYYVLDYTQTDANFGTAEEFQTLVDTAHRHGLRVILDIVLNHSGYNNIYDMNDYGYGSLADGWQDVYYGNMTNVIEKEYHGHINYGDSDGNDAALAAQWAKWWGSDWLRAGIEGYSKGGGDDTTTPVAGLPDFKTESTAIVDIPNILKTKWTREGTLSQKSAEVKNWLNSNGYSLTVNNYLCYWLSSWVREFGVDGFRCDTAKHVRPQEWSTLEEMCTKALKEWKAANPTKALDDTDFWMTGEAWEHGFGKGKDEYFTVGHFDSMINFDTCGGGLISQDKVAGTYKGYAAGINSDSEFNQLSFISSHDELLTKTQQDMYKMGSALLLLPGGVQIYYGDESGRDMVPGVPFDGYGGSGHSLRSDMNWDSMDEELLAHWQKVGKFRKAHIAVGAGTQTELEATSGYAFGRTYSKGNITDRIAGVIYASESTNVTVDVSALWNNGETVVNYYDGSAAVVTGGKVTFNSGAHGTILIGDKGDGPLISFKGDAKFKGTQKVTVSVDQADYAIISIDGGHSKKVVNGDVLTIGSTAYEGDTIAISYSSSNSKKSVNGKVTFYKAYATEDIGGGGGGGDTVKAKIHVKAADGTVPRIYAWTGSSNALSAAWPGDTSATTDDKGYYIYEYDTTGSYNVVVNNANGGKVGDIKGLKGEVWIDIASGWKSYEVTGDNIVQPEESDIVIHATALPNGSAPYLYVWDAAGKSALGGFPGTQLSEKDSDGNYVVAFKATPSVNCIVSTGSNQGQSGNLTGITAEAWITINSNDCSDVKMTKTDAVESKFAKMKAMARKSLIYTPADYTASTWKKFKDLATSAKTLIDQGEKDADATAVSAMYDKLVAAEGALALAIPQISSSAIGGKSITGTSIPGSKVTVVYSGKTYTANVNEFTGKWSVKTSTALTEGSTFTVRTAWNSKKSSKGTKTAGVVDEVITHVAPTLIAGDKQIKASWSALSGATKYRVFTYLDKKYTKVAETTGISYTITGLKNGTKYGVYIKAYINGIWADLDENYIRYATPKAGSTGIVPTLTPGNSSIKVKWNKVSGATKYRVFTYLDKKFTKVDDTTYTDYIIINLTNGIEYGVYVKAYVNGAWEALDESNIRYATPKAELGVIPTLKKTGTNTVTASWDAIKGATKYRVFLYEDGNYTKLGDTTDTSYVIKGLQTEVMYGVYVKAYVNGAWTEMNESNMRFIMLMGLIF